MFVSNANRMNPLEAKRGKFTPDAPITPKILAVSRAIMSLYALVPHSRVMCNEF